MCRGLLEGIQDEFHGLVGLAVELVEIHLHHFPQVETRNPTIKTFHVQALPVVSSSEKRRCFPSLPTLRGGRGPGRAAAKPGVSFN